MDQLEPVWRVRMCICENAANTSLCKSERNCTYAHIPTTLAFYFLRPKSRAAFRLDSPVGCYHKIMNGALEQAGFPLCGSGANENEIASLCHCKSSAALHSIFWWTTATVAQPCLAASRDLAVLIVWSQHMQNQLNPLRSIVFKARCWLNCSQLLPSPESAQHF